MVVAAKKPNEPISIVKKIFSKKKNKFEQTILYFSGRVPSLLSNQKAAPRKPTSPKQKSQRPAKPQQSQTHRFGVYKQAPQFL